MVIVQLTNGFGNNIFQYVAARQLAEFFGQEVFAVAPSTGYYATDDLKNLGIKFIDSIPRLESAVNVGDHNYNLMFDEGLRGMNFYVQGYFEDYKYYVDNLTKIKSWFPNVEVRDDNDLILHFRAGDRLFYKNEFEHKPSVESYIKAIEMFEFENLHIVTDMPEWKIITEEDLKSYKFHHNVPLTDRIKPEESIGYFNSIVLGLKKFNPTISKGSVGEDFSNIRTFKNILFEHGTLSWWASILSESTMVGVYGPWRAWKKNANKNLSNVPIEGWFKWK